MKTMIALALSALAVLLFAPTRASASTPADCQLLIDALSAQTAATTFLRGDKGVKTEEQLLHHLDVTSKELSQGDLFKAIQEMGDYETGVDRAVTADVLTLDDGAALNTSADGVIACIRQITP